MKAYEVPRNAMITLDEDAVIPPDAPQAPPGQRLKVLNLDGMYVNCLNEDGERVYIAAWTDVSLAV